MMVWRAFGRSRRGGRPQPPRISRPVVVSNEKDGEEDEAGIVFQEEDKDDMQSFMEEYDEVMTEEERRQAGAGGPTTEYDMEVVEMPDGSFSFQPRKKKGDEQPRQKQTAREFLRSKRKEGDAMSEDEWFEFLRRIGEPSADDTQAEPFVSDEQQGGGKRSKRVMAGRKPGGRYKFVDRIRVVAYGGKGGKGCISFEQLKPGVKRPSGGHGGQGGDVIFVADPAVQGLGMDRHHFHGEWRGRASRCVRWDPEQWGVCPCVCGCGRYCFSRQERGEWGLVQQAGGEGRADARARAVRDGGEGGPQPGGRRGERGGGGLSCSSTH